MISLVQHVAIAMLMAFEGDTDSVGLGRKGHHIVQSTLAGKALAIVSEDASLIEYLFATSENQSLDLSPDHATNDDSLKPPSRHDMIQAFLAKDNKLIA